MTSTSFPAISEVKILKKRRKQTSGEAFPDVRILDVQNWKCWFSKRFRKGGDFFEPQFLHPHLHTSFCLIGYKLYTPIYKYIYIYRLLLPKRSILTIDPSSHRTWGRLGGGWLEVWKVEDGSMVIGLDFCGL